MHSSIAIANEFIKRARARGVSLSHMQIQKLVYLAHGWCMAVTGKELVEDDIEAWEFGPVIRRLYDALRQYGASEVSRLIRWGQDTPFPSDDAETAIAQLSAEEEAVINKVWDTYGKYRAFQLSALTHSPDSPWSKVYKPSENKVIDNNLIYDYFSQLASAD